MQRKGHKMWMILCGRQKKTMKIEVGILGLVFMLFIRVFLDVMSNIMQPDLQDSRGRFF
jgi:hypothetical protein